jgi:hypothetical protein
MDEKQKLYNLLKVALKVAENVKAQAPKKDRDGLHDSVIEEVRWALISSGHLVSRG